MRGLVEGFRPYLALTLLAAALFLPGLATLPPLDRDESRFAQATRQMLESGDFIRIRFQDTARNKKPVGIYWLQAAAVSAFSDTTSQAVWPYRLPSFLGALAAVLLTFRAGCVLMDRRAALVGAALLAGALGIVLEAHQAKTDSVLLACAVAAQGALARFYMQGRYMQGRGGRPEATVWDALIFWLAQGLGMLIKGPIVPIISLLTIGALAVADRRLDWLRNLRPIAGMLLAAAVVAPWLAAISSATDGAFVSDAVKSDLLPKLLGAQESHGAPPGYYLALLPLFFWPGSLFVFPALFRAWRERTDPSVRFLLAWALPTFILFEIIPTKLPHYVLPAYPALALLTGAALMAAAAGRWDGLSPTDATGRRRRIWLLWCGIWALLGLALAGAFVAAPILHGGGFSVWGLLAAILALAASISGGISLARKRPLQSVLRLLLLGGAAMAVAFQCIVPALDDLWVSKRAAAAVRAADPARAQIVAVSGFHEPSLVFLLGTATKLTSGDGVAAHLKAAPGGLGLVADFEDQDFRAAIGATPVKIVAEVAGLNYSRGKKIILRLYRQEGTP